MLAFYISILYFHISIIQFPALIKSNIRSKTGFFSSQTKQIAHAEMKHEEIKPERAKAL